MESQSSLTPCVVFGQRFPIWLPILKQLGYRPVLVFLREKTYIHQVEAGIPDGCIVLSGANWQVFAADLPVLHSTHAAFVDGKPTSEVLRLSTQMTVSVVYGIGAPRGKLPDEWQLRRISVAHHHVGGVTTGTHNVVGCVHTSASKHYLQAPVPRPVVPRDLSTVLEATAPLFHLRPRAPEAEQNLEDYEVRNVGSSSEPVYHGGGWLPPKPTPYLTIKTPSVFTKEGRWTLRRLQPKEFLYAHDWGDFFVELLSSHIYEQAFPKIVPGNSLVSGVTQLATVLQDLLASTNGGGILLLLLLLLLRVPLLHLLLRVPLLHLPLQVYQLKHLIVKPRNFLTAQLRKSRHPNSSKESKILQVRKECLAKEQSGNSHRPKKSPRCYRHKRQRKRIC